MENFSLQQLIDLQNIQKELNSNKDTYLKTYRQVLKKKFRSELNNLVRADFNIVKSELKVPQLPPLPAEDENATSAVQFSDTVKDYEFTKDCLSLM